MKKNFCCHSFELCNSTEDLLNHLYFNFRYISFKSGYVNLSYDE